MKPRPASELKVISIQNATKIYNNYKLAIEINDGVPSEIVDEYERR